MVKVRPPKLGSPMIARDERRDEALDERRDERAERRADDDRDREVDDVALAG